MRDHKHTQQGFTLIEILVVIAIISTLAGLVSVMITHANRRAQRLECTKHVGELVGLIETSGGGRYANQSGPQFVLQVIEMGLFADRDSLELLFCPGDLNEDLEQAGGVEAYKQKFGPEPMGHLTSYAGRRQKEAPYRASRTGPKQVLICDDSLDHHNNEGIVVGLTGGAARFRRYDAAAFQLGEGSSDGELRCLSAE